MVFGTQCCKITVFSGLNIRKNQVLQRERNSFRLKDNLLYSQTSRFNIQKCLLEIDTVIGYHKN
jgi:hypothetical protein